MFYLILAELCDADTYTDTSHTRKVHNVLYFVNNRRWLEKHIWKAWALCRFISKYELYPHAPKFSIGTSYHFCSAGPVTDRYIKDFFWFSNTEGANSFKRRTHWMWCLRCSPRAWFLVSSPGQLSARWTKSTPSRKIAEIKGVADMKG